MSKNSLVLATRNLSLHRVEETVLEAPIEILAGSDRYLTPLDPKTLQLFFQTWVLSIDGLRIVVDPCNGNGRIRPGLPHFDNLNVPFLERFSETGISPSQIDIVFCTHLHCDHCGWNTHLRDGRWVPTFPNARYLMVHKEVDRWDDSRVGYAPVDYNATVFEESIKPIIEAGLAEFVDEKHAVQSGITIEPAHGHTAGHSILRVASGRDDIVYFTGDAFHHPLQVRDPHLHLPGCDDLKAAIGARDVLRRRMADESALMVPAHFPPPHIGRIVFSQGEFSFSPGENLS